MKLEILLGLFLLAFIVIVTHCGLTYADPILKDGNVKAELVFLFRVSS